MLVPGADVPGAVRAAATAGQRARPLVVVLIVAWLLSLDVLVTVAAEVFEFGAGDPFAASDVVFLPLTLLATFAAVVVWVAWFHSVYRGVGALGLARYLPMWGIVGWLIPYANVFVPKQLVNDLWPGPARPPAVVQAWWVVYVVPTALGAVGWLPFLDDSSPPAPVAVVYVLSLVLLPPLAVWTARAVTARLDLLVAEAVAAHAADAADAAPVVARTG